MKFSKSPMVISTVSCAYRSVQTEYMIKGQAPFFRSRQEGMLVCKNCLRNFTTEVAIKEKYEAKNLSKEKAKRAKKEKKSTQKLCESKKDIKTKSASSSVQLVLDHVYSHCGTKTKSLNLPNLLSKRFLKPYAVIPTSVYIIDEDEAKNIGQAIMLENPDIESPVLELHPGLGLLTSQLLKEIGFKYITGLEDNAALGENLVNRFNMPIVDCSIDDLPRHHHLDKHDGGERINSVLSSIAVNENHEDSMRQVEKKQLYMIGAIPHVCTINFLLRCYATRRVFFEDDLPWSGVTLFVALGPKAAHICTATPKTGLVAYRPTSVMFQTFFKFKEIGTVPRKAFVPWETEDAIGRKRRMTVADPNFLRLMRVEINHKVQDRIGKDNLFAYWYFVRQHLYARKSRIIPELERWIPGCGVKLIKQGFTIFSQFGSLQPEEILDLYLQFTSWPEFTNSSFSNAVEKFQTRLEITEEEDPSK